MSDLISHYQKHLKKLIDFDFLDLLGTKLTRKPLQRRRGRQVSNTSQGNTQSYPNSTGTNVQVRRNQTGGTCGIS